MLLYLASAGPLTGAFEEIATSIGSGVVVGSFAVGLATFARGSSRKRLEGRGLVGGYIGGVGALVLLALDIVWRRFV